MSNQFIFKWGTCLMLFFWLNRFSEDLDFSMLKYKHSTINQLIEYLKNKGYKISSQRDLEKVAWFNVDYQIGWKKYICNVDFWKNNYWIIPKFSTTNLFGSQLNVLDLNQAFAHKCCAFLERGIVNHGWRAKGRDVFDVDFFINKCWLNLDFSILKVRENIETSLDLAIALFSTLFFAKSSNYKSYIQDIQEFSNVWDANLFIQQLLLKLLNYFPNWFELTWRQKIERWDMFVPITKELCLMKNEKTGWKYAFFSMGNLNKPISWTFANLDGLRKFVQKNFSKIIKWEKLS